MNRLRFFFSAIFIETLGIALAAWLLFAAPMDATDQPNSPTPANTAFSDWLERYNFPSLNKLPEANQRQAMVRAKLESTADKLATAATSHFNAVLKQTVGE